MTADLYYKRPNAHQPSSSLPIFIDSPEPLDSIASAVEGVLIGNTGGSPQNKKLSYHWQTARHICAIYANAMTWLWPPKHAPPPYVLLYAEFGLCVKGVVRTPKLGRAETPLSWDERRGWTKIHAPAPTPHCVTTSNLVVLRKGCIRINRNEPPEMDSAGMPHVCYHLIDLGQTIRALVMRSAWKMTPRDPLFEGHSIKVVASRNRHGSIRYLWLNSY